MVGRICDVAKDIEGKIKFWETGLSELKADHAAQEKIVSEPFAYENELSEKRARYNELWAELNPDESQQMADEGDQEQSRKYLEDAEDKRYNKRSYYSQAETEFLSWSNSVDPVEKVKKFNRFGKIRFYEKTADGCVELSPEQYEERVADNVRAIDNRAKSEIGKVPNLDESGKRTKDGDTLGTHHQGTSESLSKQAVGEELRSDTGGSISAVRGSSNGTDVDNEQHQQRTNTLTDRAVLEFAANEIKTDDFTAAEKEAECENIPAGLLTETACAYACRFRDAVVRLPIYDRIKKNPP